MLTAVLTLWWAVQVGVPAAGPQPALHDAALRVAKLFADLFGFLAAGIFAELWWSYRSLSKETRMNASVTTQLPGLRSTADRTETSGRKDIHTGSDSQPSDEVLLKEVSSGGTEALSELFKRYARIVRGVAYKVVRDPPKQTTSCRTSS
jgi:hypothetical protein